MMRYEHVAIPDSEIPPAAHPLFAHLLQTYASETNKTASMWRHVGSSQLDFRPDDRVNSIRQIVEHQLLSERRFFSVFVGTNEPDPAACLPSGSPDEIGPYLELYVTMARRRLEQLARGDEAWWMEERPFFDGLVRQRIWIFWRRVLHTCHHRTQVQTWLRLAGAHVPAIYGPSGDVRGEADDPTTSIEAASRPSPGSLRPVDEA